jgi:uncharacterized protein (DUF885 family)
LEMKKAVLFITIIAVAAGYGFNKNHKQDQSAMLNAWFDKKFEEGLMDSPETLTELGRKERKSELDDISEAKELERLEKKKKDLAALLKFDPTVLDDQTRLSFQLYRKSLEEAINNEKFRHYTYPVNQMHGMQSELPSFMINKHLITDIKDAEAYISRLEVFPKKFDQLIEALEIRAKKNIIVPKFVFTHLYNDCNNIIGDVSKPEEQLLYKDFSGKIEKLALSPDEKKKLLEKAKYAVTVSVVPSYHKLVSYLKTLEKKAPDIVGVWRFKDGDAFYNYRLRQVTTTNMKAEEIFTLGQKEVARIHNEMADIMKQVGFKGTLKEFFAFVQKDPQFYYPNTSEGKSAMISGYQSIVDSMEKRLDELFYTKPKARMIVKAVEPYREKSAGKAFYEHPALDGSRPGTFYANLYNTADMPKYEMEALAYHEGIPGHHMQISIAQELQGLPEFRKHGHYTAYIEGWGLYCELIPKEMGFYSDPYSDFGRLAMELWRACRLVVDAGLHYRRWTREEAIKYLMDNTPNTENSCKKAIERYIVMPGQATAYKVGMIKLVELREKAKKELGDKFDVRKFHDVILLSGPVPLDVVEERVNAWVKEARK